MRLVGTLVDYEHYFAGMVTGEDFGCTSHEPIT